MCLIYFSDNSTIYMIKTCIDLAYICMYVYVYIYICIYVYKYILNVPFICAVSSCTHEFCCVLFHLVLIIVNLSFAWLELEYCTFSQVPDCTDAALNKWSKSFFKFSMSLRSYWCRLPMILAPVNFQSELPMLGNLPLTLGSWEEMQKFDKILGICLHPWDHFNEYENLTISQEFVHGIFGRHRKIWKYLGKFHV